MPRLSLLGLPALGLSLAITAVSVLVPLILRRYTTSSTLIGVVVAGEGVLALLVPVWIGGLSDRTRTAIGGRLPYVLAGAALCTPALFVLPFARSILGIGAVVFLFYLGYFVYYPAYRALFADLVPTRHFARSQGIEALFREIGLALALTLCPLLFTFWEPLPFFFSGAVLAALSLLYVERVRRRLPKREARPIQRDPDRFAILRQPGVRRVLIANALWEFAMAGLKSFVLLYVVVGTGRSPAVASTLMGIVALVAMIAAPIAGRLGDRFGVIRVMRVALVVYTVGLLLPCFTSSLAVLLPAMPLIGFGGAVAMTLPYALLSSYLPNRNHGLGAGLFEFSRGVGAILGPMVTGTAIDVLAPFFASTQGYAAMWLVQAIALFISLPLLPAAVQRAPRSGPSIPAAQNP